MATNPAAIPPVLGNPNLAGALPNHVAGNAAVTQNNVTADTIRETNAHAAATADKEMSGTLDDDEQTAYPGPRALALILLALYVAVFLVALDRTILATAIPRITDEFRSLGDVGWYGGSYLLTSCAFQLSFGRIYTFYNPKIVFLIAIIIFEVGSAVCGAAPTSNALIVGRAIAGLGASGIFSGAIIILVHTTPLAKRAAYGSALGGIFGLASVVGPVMGGAFTQNVTWRWCFYINLPIGALAFGIIVLILHLPNPTPNGLTVGQRFAKLDPIGTFFFLPGLICLLLALQWGGSTYAWSDGRIIALFVLAGALIIGFIVVQILKPKTATVPPHIIKQRSIWGGVLFAISIGAVLVIQVYYLPIWFQAILGVDAVNSGIRLLPLVLALVIASIISGGMINGFGYYTPFMIGSAILMSIGAGLVTTFTPSTGESKWLGYQVILGFGLGFGMQAASLAAQTVLRKEDISTGVALMLFAQSLSGAVFIAISQSTFTNALISSLSGVAHLDAYAIVHTGATDLRRVVDASDLPFVLEAYNNALMKPFIVCLALACFTIVGALATEWRSVKPEVKPGKEADPEALEMGEVDKAKAEDVKEGSEDKGKGVDRSVVKDQDGHLVGVAA